MPNSISNSDDLIDSRDVIARIRELRKQEATATDCVDCGEPLAECDPSECGARARLSEDEDSELAGLESLEQDVNSPSWKSGVTLISENYFEEYARQTAEDTGAIENAAAWPCDHIDWNAAADALKMDYSQVDFDGETYWYRG